MSELRIGTGKNHTILESDKIQNKESLDEHSGVLFLCECMSRFNTFFYHRKKL